MGGLIWSLRAPMARALSRGCPSAPRGAGCGAVSEPTEPGERARERWTTAFGWIAGGALGLMVNYGLARAVGESYPVTVTTFVAFLLGAFGGMAAADRLGARGFKPLALAAGVLLAVFVGLVLVSLLTPDGTP